jgi:AcrR family transcriptional regulator
MNIRSQRQTRTRAYRQTARAETAQVTREKILSAFERCFHTHWFDEVTLEEVARNAGVTVRTVIRRFGSKNGLLSALIETMTPAVAAQRTPAAGNAEDLVDRTLLVYERIGDGVIINLAQEGRVPELRPLIEIGRREHRRINRETFATSLEALGPAKSQRLLDLLVIATDIYTWKLLRRDMGRSVGQTRRTMLAMIYAALRQSRTSERTRGARDL